MNPARDWAILLSVAGVALAGALAWHFWAFRTVVEGGALVRLPPPAEPVADKAALEAIQATIAHRAAEAAKYAGGTYLLTDPSQAEAAEVP
jgi:hypothetical protein